MCFGFFFSSCGESRDSSTGVVFLLRIPYTIQFFRFSRVTTVSQRTINNPRPSPHLAPTPPCFHPHQPTPYSREHRFAKLAKTVLRRRDENANLKKKKTELVLWNPDKGWIATQNFHQQRRAYAKCHSSVSTTKMAHMNSRQQDKSKPAGTTKITQLFWNRQKKKIWKQPDQSDSNQIESKHVRNKKTNQKDEHESNQIKKSLSIDGGGNAPLYLII